MVQPRRLIFFVDVFRVRGSIATIRRRVPRLYDCFQNILRGKDVLLYRKLNEVIGRSMPVVPLFHDQVTHFVRKEVKGWKVSPVNRLDLREVRKGEMP